MCAGLFSPPNPLTLSQFPGGPRQAIPAGPKFPRPPGPAGPAGCGPGFDATPGLGSMLEANQNRPLNPAGAPGVGSGPSFGGGPGSAIEGNNKLYNPLDPGSAPSLPDLSRSMLQKGIYPSPPMSFGALQPPLCMRPVPPSPRGAMGGLQETPGGAAQAPPSLPGAPWDMAHQLRDSFRGELGQTTPESVSGWAGHSLDIPSGDSRGSFPAPPAGFGGEVLMGDPRGVRGGFREGGGGGERGGPGEGIGVPWAPPSWANDPPASFKFIAPSRDQPDSGSNFGHLAPVIGHAVRAFRHVDPMEMIAKGIFPQPPADVLPKPNRSFGG